MRLNAIDGVEGVEISIDHPVVFDAPASAMINGYIEEFVTSMVADAVGLSGLEQGAVGSTWDVLMVRGDLISLRITEVFVGASAAEITYAVTADLLTGERFGLGEVFDPRLDWEPAVEQLVCAEVRAIAPDIDELPCVAEGSLHDPGNLGLTRDNLVLMFDECELTACAAGRIDILLPLSEFGAWLDPEGPLG